MGALNLHLTKSNRMLLIYKFQLEALNVLLINFNFDQILQGITLLLSSPPMAAAGLLDADLVLFLLPRLRRYVGTIDRILANDTRFISGDISPLEVLCYKVIRISHVACEFLRGKATNTLM